MVEERDAMVAVLRELRVLVVAPDETRYRPRVCGAIAHDGTSHWHGWIEFVPIDGGPVIRTARETTQPNRMCALYWSTGLTPVYMDGALKRALARTPPPQCERTIPPAAVAFRRDLRFTPDDRRFLKSIGIAADERVVLDRLRRFRLSM
jgi:hypothetical protein